ncbi:alpha/beta fold hydrolase [Biformimicrobium ophioploci]|uniref:Alpha/beta hydrolase n=1 Tax=Biformimicrobium ophioploci TaxID=3036711 RepID=A0ABQ6LZS6_9GAMM|nr:alpha/beta hydrolase [Microbulbifer sp. NKW57]GMG87556.1 alpha/beta hydrolase [Microbulbifer sp. NKW57]
MQDYLDLHYKSSDGLTLYARDYHGSQVPADRPVLMLLHGLTRNSRDFESLAAHLANDFRVIVPDQRGRGLSQWDPEIANYQPATYVADMFTLIEQLGTERVVVIGTSMGGLMGMIMVAMQREKIAGLVLNDIGPEVHEEGLARIKSYVGKTAPAKTWEDAAATVKELNSVAFPNYSPEDWMRMARQLYTENEQGVPVLAYDPAIAKPISADGEAAVPPDLWPLFEGLKGLPSLTIRGALSDILAKPCFEEMQARLPEMAAAEIPECGHAPALDEPDSVNAIDTFLNQFRVAGA